MMRWQLAMPFMILTGLFLFGTSASAWFNWSSWSLAERLITVCMIVIFALTFGTSVSIGVDRRIDDVPWLRMGVIALYLALGCGVTLVRRNL
jgi:uncharacterized membrane protein